MMNKVFYFLVLTSFLLGFNAQAQTLNDVIGLFNDAAESTNKGDYNTAIIDFEKLLEIGPAVGDSANDLVSKAKEQLPVLYWQVSAAFLKQKKFEEAIPSLEKTVEYASEFDNNSATKERAARMLPQVYYAVGTQKFRDKNYEEAISIFNKAINHDAAYSKAYLGKGLAYAEMQNEKNMVENLEAAIKLAKAENDPKTVETAVQKLVRYYSDLGDEELEAIDPEEKDFKYAMEYYEKALSYDKTAADPNYKMAMIYNQISDFDKAIESCKNALSTETVDVKIAAIQLELGNAYFNIAQYSDACEAYNKAMVGPIEEMAIRRKEKVPGCN